MLNETHRAPPRYKISDFFSSLLVASLYGEMFRRLIVVDSFFGSCGVFTPPHLTLDLRSICAYSGYVHSCGLNVFSRGAYKVQKEEFFTALHDHLMNHLPGGKRAFFAVYSHEDFTRYDRRWAKELLDGLDNVKLFVEKYYVGPYSLVSVLREMQDTFKDQLVIPEAGNFRSKHEKLREDATIDSSRTVWLILDHSIGEDYKHIGDDRYFICYDQVYKNENPFHYFDENKPAWIAPTTIPHSLMAAMINITKPWKCSSKTFTLADPFVGSGTTWLEMLKHPHVVCSCGDLQPLAPLLVEDNLAFLAASANELEGYLAYLKNLNEPSASQILLSPEQIRDDRSSCAQSYDWALRNLNRILSENATEVSLPGTDVIKELRKGTRVDRLFLYIALRTRLRHHLAFQRGSEEWAIAYQTEASTLFRQFEALWEMRQEQEKAQTENESVIVFAGGYSQSCTISPRLLRNAFPRKKSQLLVKVEDARRLRRGSCDVIVTDPPYGFNEEDDPGMLARLYADIIEVLILALKAEGQIVFAVPDWSYTGRRLSFFTHKEIITQQVLVIAEKTNREVFHSAMSVPNPGLMFRPPYYWESERALRRAILHFRLRST